MKSLFLISAASVAVLASFAEPNTPKADEMGTIEGKVVFEGERPKPKPDLVIQDKEATGCHHDLSMLDKKDRTLLISKEGGVANVVFTLEVKDQEVKVPEEPTVLDQTGCRFEPHVVLLPVGGTLRYDNSDETNHNVHAYARKNDSPNKNISGGTSFEQKMEHAEVFEVKCDVHPWMKSYVFVTDATHYAKSSADGSFKLTGVPPGTYKLSYWHEELGKGKTEEVTVKAGETTKLEQKLGAESSDKKGGGRRRRR